MKTEYKRYTASMYDHNLPHYVGLDVGTNTVRCIVGVLDQDSGTPSVIGYGSSPNHGMRKGTVVYVDDVSEAIAQAITEAERISGFQIHRATVNINGSNVNGFNSKGVIAISTANREITHEDRLRAEEAATILKLPPNREIVQVFAKNYRLDGQDNIKDPVGMQGVRLEVDAHIVTASLPHLRNLDSALDKVEIIPNRHTVSSLAAAEAVLSRQQKESGTLLLDIGAGTTNLVAIEEGEIQHVAVLPIGGINITNDLAIGLKTDLDIAEEVKVKCATLDQDHKKEAVSVELNKKVHTFKTSDILMITEARIDELLDYVDKELRMIHRSRKLPGGVVIVGGTAKFPGLADFTRDKLELPARIGKLHNITGLIESVDDPVNFTAVGLMLLDMLLAPMNEGSAGFNVTARGKLFNPVSKLINMIRR